MNTKNITCPECQAEFPIDEVLTSQITESLKREMEQTFKEKERSITEKIRKEFHAKHSLDTKDLTESLKEKEVTIKNLENAELNARKTNRQFIELKKNFEKQLESKAEKIQSENKINYENKLLKVKEKYNFEKESELAEKQKDFTELTIQLRNAKNKSLEWKNKVLEEQNKVNNFRGAAVYFLMKKKCNY